VRSLQDDRLGVLVRRFAEMRRLKMLERLSVTRVAFDVLLHWWKRVVQMQLLDSGRDFSELNLHRVMYLHLMDCWCDFVVSQLHLAYVSRHIPERTLDRVSQLDPIKAVRDIVEVRLHGIAIVHGVYGSGVAIQARRVVLQLNTLETLAQVLFRAPHRWHRRDRVSVGVTNVLVCGGVVLVGGGVVLVAGGVVLVAGGVVLVAGGVVLVAGGVVLVVGGVVLVVGGVVLVAGGVVLVAGILVCRHRGAVLWLSGGGGVVVGAVVVRVASWVGMQGRGVPETIGFQ